MVHTNGNGQFAVQANLAWINIRTIWFIMRTIMTFIQQLMEREREAGCSLTNEQMCLGLWMVRLFLHFMIKQAPFRL
ncbi:hypothetical protein D3C75_684450 [compost metagenome]